MHKKIFGLMALLLMGALVLTACGGGGGESGGGDQPAAGDEATAPADQGGDQAASSSDQPPAPTGSAVISGTVNYTGDVPQLRPLDMGADPACAAMHDEPVMPDMLVLGDGNTMGNIFVKVTNPPEGSYPVPSEAVVVDQDGCRYEPHVVGVRAGQTLLFKNSDNLLHNVHGLPEENRDFNIGMPASVTEKETVLNEPEPLFPVKCDVHPWMQAFVAVMSHPYFAVTDPDGAFEISGLPAGTYTVEAWHERLGTQTGEVTVDDGGTATVNFEFSS